MADKDFSEILAAEFISVTGGLLAGIGLAFMAGKISLIPGLFILIPGFLEMRGNLSGSMSSRISSGLFLGVLKPSMRDRIIKSNMLATAILVVVISLVLGIIAYASSLYFFGIENFSIVIISVIAGMVSLSMTPLTVYTTIWIFRKGHDPNNIMGPYVTTLGDFVSVFAFMIAIAVVS